MEAYLLIRLFYCMNPAIYLFSVINLGCDTLSMLVHVHSPKKVKDINFFGGYFLLNCNDKSRIIKNTPKKNNILNFFWGVYIHV